MQTTAVVTDQQLEVLASKLAALDGLLDETDRIALLTVFELAGEALAARLDDVLEVSGFAQQPYTVGIQVGVPSVLPSPGDALNTSLAKGKKGRKAGGGQQEYFQVTLHECMVSSY